MLMEFKVSVSKGRGKKRRLTLTPSQGTCPPDAADGALGQSSDIYLSLRAQRKRVNWCYEIRMLMFVKIQR